MRGPRLVLATALALSGCRATTDAAAVPSEAPRADGRRHLQVVRPLTTGDRRARWDAFVSRNPGGWTFEDVTQVDPLAGYVVRGRRADAGVDPGPPLEERAVEDVAFRFVERNADLLGVARVDLPKLDVAVVEVELPRDVVVVPPGARVAVVRGAVPARGFQAFSHLASRITLFVVVAPRGEVVAFRHVSEIHPKIDLTVDPRLRPDDPRVVAKVVGRTVFALVEDEPDGPTRSLRRRVDLGTVRAEDVRDVRPDVFVSDGPMGAYRTYRLVYVVDVAKPRAASFPEPEDERYFFFSWRVDPDTGDIVDEARVPVAEARDPDGDIFP